MNAVIKPWLTAGLFITIAANVLLSAALIVNLSRFQESIRQADEAEARAAQRRSDVSKLQAQLETLAKQRDALAPEVANWQERLEQKAAAEAVLASLEAKKHQLHSDIDQDAKRSEEARQAVIAARQHETEVTANIQKLQTERSSLTRTVAEAKELEETAVDAERRKADATAATESADARRKQIEAETLVMQATYERLENDTNGLRRAKEQLSADVAVLRNEKQEVVKHLSALDPKKAEFKALQAQTTQELQNFAKAQQQVTTAEVRTAELETCQQQANSELARLTSRVEVARTRAAEWETKRDLSQQQGTTAAQDLAEAQKALAGTQASEDQLAREQTRLASIVASFRKDLEQARKDSVEAETRLAGLRAEAQRCDAELAGARKTTQEHTTKHDELIRDESRMQAIVEKLRQEKDTLEKEIGKLEAVKEKKPSDDQ